MSLFAGLDGEVVLGGVGLVVGHVRIKMCI